MRPSVGDLQRRLDLEPVHQLEVLPLTNHARRFVDIVLHHHQSVREAADRTTLQSMLDAGVKELPGVASRYGLTVTSASAMVDD